MTIARTDERSGIDPGVITVSEMIGVLWRAKFWLSGFTFGFAVIAAIVALSLNDVYRAEALLAPNEKEGVGGLSGLAASYGGLASLAGISLDNGGADDIDLGLETLKSRRFISQFVSKHKLLVPLIAAEGWDRNTGELEIDASVYDIDEHQWVRKVSSSRSVVPSDQEAYEEFRRILTIRKRKETGLISIAIDHYSPRLAKQWADLLVADINETIMQRDLDEASKSIQFLKNRVNETSLKDLRTVFYSLIEEQTKTMLLASVSDEYFLRTIDPAIVPERKVSPKRALIVMFGAMIGAFLGLIVALTRERKQNVRFD